MAIRRLTPAELSIPPDELEESVFSSPLDRDDIASIALSTVLAHEERISSSSTSTTPGGLDPFKPKTRRLKSITGKNLSLKQLRTIERLIDQQPGESINDICFDMSIHRQTLQKWLRHPAFALEYRARVESTLAAHRAQVGDALVRGAVAPGTGQSSMQKLYWQRMGELADRTEISGPNGGPIQVEASPISADDLPFYLRCLLIAHFDGKQISDGLKMKIIQESGIVTTEDYREIVAHEKGN